MTDSDRPSYLPRESVELLAGLEARTADPDEETTRVTLTDGEREILAALRDHASDELDRYAQVLALLDRLDRRVDAIAEQHGTLATSVASAGSRAGGVSGAAWGSLAAAVVAAIGSVLAAMIST